ncbi:hypothetical protein T265_14597, partial [Opisthorchis viverrini]
MIAKSSAVTVPPCGNSVVAFTSALCRSRHLHISKPAESSLQEAATTRCRGGTNPGKPMKSGTQTFFCSMEEMQSVVVDQLA